MTNVAADIRALSIGLIVAGVVTLHLGGYRLLDRITKLFVAVFTVATLLVTILSLPRLEWQFGQVVLPLTGIDSHRAGLAVNRGTLRRLPEFEGRPGYEGVLIRLSHRLS